MTATESLFFGTSTTFATKSATKADIPRRAGYLCAFGVKRTSASDSRTISPLSYWLSEWRMLETQSSPPPTSSSKIITPTFRVKIAHEHAPSHTDLGTATRRKNPHCFSLRPLFSKKLYKSRPLISSLLNRRVRFGEKWTERSNGDFFRRVAVPRSVCEGAWFMSNFHA